MGKKTRAKLPLLVSESGYGERLSALVSWLSSDYRQSHGQLQQLLKRLFEIDISRASINRLRQEMSQALEWIVIEAHEYVKTQSQMHSDETSFKQGNYDGHAKQQKGSVVTSLKAQGRDVWDFLTSVCRAARFDLEMPFPLNL